MPEGDIRQFIRTKPQDPLTNRNAPEGEPPGASKTKTLHGFQHTQQEHNIKGDIKRLIGSWGRDKMKAEKAWLQSIVWSLMQTLLEDHPTLLSHTERSNLMDADCCKDALGLKLSNLPLLRHLGDGIVINGHPRYWAPRCGDYYVCSQWWKAHHRHNAEMLQRFVDSLISRNRDDPGVPALNRHRVVLEKASLRQSTP